MMPTFDAIDLNDDGMISQQEFEEYGQSYSELEAKWSQFDEDDDGNLDEDEFAQFTADIMPPKSETDTESTSESN